MDATINVQQNIIEDYYEGKVLGQGAFGKALLCNKQTENNKPYVIKVINLLENSSPSRAYELVMNEIFILDVLRNSCDEYIMCYIRTIIKDPMIYIVCEYLENYKPISQLIKQRDYNTQNLARLCNNLWLGLEKLHSLNIYHRDIKPDNVMYNVNSWDIKYIDFGLAAMYIDGVTNSNTRVAVGTPNYLYPKLLTNNAKRTDGAIVLPSGETLKLADMFSLGMMFFVLLTKGKTVYQLMDVPISNNPKEVYKFNANLKNHIKTLRTGETAQIKQFWVDQGVLMFFKLQNNYKYESFDELMGLTNVATSNEKKGGTRRKLRTKNGRRRKNQGMLRT